MGLGQEGNERPVTFETCLTLPVKGVSIQSLPAPRHPESRDTPALSGPKAVLIAVQALRSRLVSIPPRKTAITPVPISPTTSDHKLAPLPPILARTDGVVINAGRKADGRLGALTIPLQGARRVGDGPPVTPPPADTRPTEPSISRFGLVQLLTLTGRATSSSTTKAPRRAPSLTQSDAHAQENTVASRHLKTSSSVRASICKGRLMGPFAARDFDRLMIGSCGVTLGPLWL